ncbi:MAG: zinc-binding dehydrogenase [Solirubrobacteraceae bacterium]
MAGKSWGGDLAAGVVAQDDRRALGAGGVHVAVRSRLSNTTEFVASGVRALLGSRERRERVARVPDPSCRSRSSGTSTPQHSQGIPAVCARGAASVLLGWVLIAEHHNPVHAMIADLIVRVETRELRVAVDRTFPLADAAAAHAYIESRQTFSRVLMTP